MKSKIVKFILLSGLAVLFTNCTREVHVQTAHNIDRYQTIVIAKGDFSCEARSSGTAITNKFFIKKGQKFGAMDLSRYFIPGATRFSEKTYFPEGSIAVGLAPRANIITVIPIYLNGAFTVEDNPLFTCWNGAHCRQDSGSCTKLEGGNFEVENR